MATTSATWYQKFTLTASFARRAITAFGRFRSSGFSAIGTKSEKKITFSPSMFTFSISKQFTTNAHTEEPWCNKPLYNKDLGIMNNFVYPSNRKIYGKVPWYDHASLWRTNFASPLALCYIEDNIVPKTP